MIEGEYKKYETLIRDFVKESIDTVLKQPRSFIKYPFVDPGSVYGGNIWDWDTYWSVYGLLGMADTLEPTIREKIIEHSKGNIFNFFDHQMEDGYIPMMIEVGEWKEPYLNMKHKEGVLMNMHKPFLCGQICMISDYIKDYSWIEKYQSQLDKYFDCYDSNYYFKQCGLYVWCDDIMIGMDNDPASFGRPKFSTANIFLNSFMVAELKCMARIMGQFNKNEQQEKYLEKANRLIHAIQEECWDKRDKFFYSVDVDIKTRSFDWFHKGLGVFWNTLPIKIQVWSGFIPMWEGFATKEEAEALVGHWKDETTFASPYGVATLAKDEKMFNLSVTNNPSNWLGPIWVIANYIVFKGMLNYGYIEEAEDMCKRTLLLLGQDIETTGSLHEYYDPYTGNPIMNGGFVNWNILVLNMVQELEKIR